jgi:hypothetical protein
MDSRIVAMTDVDASFIERWRALANRPDTTPNPFVDVDFLRPAATYLSEAKGLRLFVGEDHGDLVCLMPLIPSSQLGAIRMVPGLRNLIPHSWLGQPLIAAGQESAAASSLLRFLSERPRTFWLRLQWLLADNSFAQSLLADGRASIEVESHGSIVRQPDAKYLSGHSSLNRRRRQFERSSGKTLDVIDCSADPHAVDEFLTMEAAGWKGADGGAYAARPGHADFLKQMCSNFRDSGNLQLLSLRTGDQTLAMQLMLAAGDTLYGHATTYDEGYAALSPGIQLQVESFQLFHAQPRFRLLDSCADPDNTTVNRLFPDRRDLVNLVIGSGLLGRAIVSLAPAGRRFIERRQVAATAAREPSSVSVPS